jgi:hypothetical protein
MSTTFKLTYTNARGERVTERPRLMFTADGLHKALFVGEDTVLAAVPMGEPDAVLWQLARDKARAQ